MKCYIVLSKELIVLKLCDTLRICKLLGDSRFTKVGKNNYAVQKSMLKCILRQNLQPTLFLIELLFILVTKDTDKVNNFCFQEFSWLY